MRRTYLRRSFLDLTLGEGERDEDIVEESVMCLALLEAWIKAVGTVLWRWKEDERRHNMYADTDGSTIKREMEQLSQDVRGFVEYWIKD